MKILFLNFWASMPGGAEHSLIDIIRLASHLHKVQLITSEPGFLTENVTRAGCESIILPFKKSLSSFKRQHLIVNAFIHFGTLLSFLGYCFSVRKKVISEKPDIIHANVPKSHILLHFLIISGFKGKAVFHQREIFRKNTPVYFLYSLLFRINKASVIAISHAVFDALPGSMKKNGIVIYNGISIPATIPAVKVNVQPPAFLYLGRVVPWKGCDLLIDAFSRLFSKYTEKAGHLSIVGGTYYWDSSYRESLKEKIHLLKLKQHISLSDHTSDITELFFQHTILCVPSDNEPFGRVAAEAMAFGLPVIGFLSGGLPEVVKDKETGLLTKERTADSFCDLMGYFIKHPEEIAKMGSRARNRCADLFDIEKQGPVIVNAIVN